MHQYWVCRKETEIVFACGGLLPLFMYRYFKMCVCVCVSFMRQRTIGFLLILIRVGGKIKKESVRNEKNRWKKRRKIFCFFKILKKYRKEIVEISYVKEKRVIEKTKDQEFNSHIEKKTFLGGSRHRHAHTWLNI